MHNIYYEKIYMQKSLKRIYRFRLQILLPIIFIVSLLMKNMLIIFYGFNEIIPLFLIEAILGMVIIYRSIKLERKTVKMNYLAVELFTYSIRWLFQMKRLENFKLIYLSIIVTFLDGEYIGLTGNVSKYNAFVAFISLVEILVSLIIPILIIWVTLTNVISIHYQEIVAESGLDDNQEDLHLS